MFFRPSIHLILFPMYCFVLMSCANTTEQSLQEISVGMDKAMVLDIVGDPYSTDRKDSVDEWLFPYYVEGQKKYKKVYFKYGKVVEIVNYSPSDEELPASYEDYENKIKSKQKQKRGEFKDLGE